MRRKPETLAWIAIVGSFAVFCVLVAGLVFAAYWYWSNAYETRWARLTVIEGAVAVKDPKRLEPVVGHSDQLLQEGATVVTNASSRAFLTLFDSSTVTIYPDTELTLTSLRTLRFRGRDALIALHQNLGKTIVGVAPPSVRTRFQVMLAPASVVLAEGAYSLETNGQAGQVKVREVGSASVAAGSRSVQVRSRHLVEIVGDRLGIPRPLGEEMIANGQFLAKLAGWQQGKNDLVPDVLGKVEMASDGDRPAARFVRLHTRGSWAETYLHQNIDRDVTDALSVRLSIDLKLVHQDVQGGGDRGSEYPMLVRIDYRTASGWDGYWVRGFYYTNTNNSPTTNGVQLPPNQWVTYVEPQDLLSLDPKPKEIRSIRLIASGHDYESLVGRISLLAE